MNKDAFRDMMIKHRELNSTEKPLSDDAVLSDAAGMREEFASFAHKQWSGWMEYLFSKCTEEEIENINSEGFTTSIKKTGCYIIPKWAVERWKQQLKTEYNDLSEQEKESDRKEADGMLEIMRRRFT